VGQPTCFFFDFFWIVLVFLFFLIVFVTDIFKFYRIRMSEVSFSDRNDGRGASSAPADADAG